MNNGMNDIKEAHLVEEKVANSEGVKGWRSREKNTTSQGADCHHKTREDKKEEVERRLEEIFSKGSRQDMEKATSIEKTIERIEELSKWDEQLEE